MPCPPPLPCPLFSHPQKIKTKLQTLSKSFKLVPIMLMGKMLTNKNYPIYEYLTAVAIGFGNTLFMMATENLDLGVDSFGQVGGYEVGTSTAGGWVGVRRWFPRGCHRPPSAVDTPELPD